MRACGYTPRYGVFTIALATALREHGLEITFHSDSDPDMKPLERRFYRRAQNLQIRVLPPVTLPELLGHAAAGCVPIVFYDTPSGEAHFSPLLGEERGRLILPMSDGGSMTKQQFLRYWSGPEILGQCVIVRGRPGELERCPTKSR
jgi:hypothetical protein